MEYETSFLVRTIKVTAEQKVDIPLKGIIGYFGGKDFSLKATATSRIEDPDEYIRNIDYGVEIAGQIADFISDKVGGLIDDFIDKKDSKKDDKKDEK